MAASGWIGIRKKNYQVAGASKQYNFQAETYSTVPDIFQLIPQINIDIIIVGLHFQRKQCDVNNSVITQYIISAKRCVVTGAYLHNRGDRSPAVNTRGDRRRDRSP